MRQRGRNRGKRFLRYGFEMICVVGSAAFFFLGGFVALGGFKQYSEQEYIGSAEAVATPMQARDEEREDGKTGQSGEDKENGQDDAGENTDIGDNLTKAEKNWILNELRQEEFGKKFIKRLRKDERLWRIAANREEYPDRLIEAMLNYPETTDFVLDYPTCKNREYPIDLEECTMGEIPLFIQWDKRWGYTPYGDSMTGIAGCGPVCLSMVAVGLTGDTRYDPKWMTQFSEENGYWVQGSGTAWLLLSEGAGRLGLLSERLELSDTVLRGELQAGHPIICSMRPGDFTYTGHFIVLAGIKQGKVIVNDPNSRNNSEKLWDMETLLPQIKAAWSFYFAL